jgi:hypothetical protein
VFHELEPAHFKKVLPLYEREEGVFPLILAVIRGIQPGWVFANDPVFPSSALIITRFGFIQYTGAVDPDAGLFEFFRHPDPRLPNYILWYAPPLRIQTYLDKIPAENIRRRERMRFVYNTKKIAMQPELPSGFEIHTLDKDTLARTHHLNLDITSRFWSSAEDFWRYGIGVCVMNSGEVVSLCYSACVAGGMAEVDVITQDGYRGKGLALVAARQFILECAKRNIVPTWDCFTNNTASMKLAQKLGFEKVFSYNFYSFNLPFASG